MSIQIKTVIDSIRKLVIEPDVNILDVDFIPDELSSRNTPIFYPSPVDMITGFRIERETLGSDAQAAKNVFYTLNYIYAHQPVGSGRDLAQIYSDMLNNVVDILNNIADNSAPSGAVEVTPRLDGNIGIIEDPAGNQFFGCAIAVDVLEFYEE